MHVALEEIANSGSSFLVAVSDRRGGARTRAERHPRAAAAMPISSPKSLSTVSASTPHHPRFAPGDVETGTRSW